jgi:hypothetical protein
MQQLLGPGYVAVHTDPALIAEVTSGRQLQYVLTISPVKGWPTPLLTRKVHKGKDRLIVNASSHVGARLSSLVTLYLSLLLDRFHELCANYEVLLAGMY